jgi:predicted dehydrogenase
MSSPLSIGIIGTGIGRQHLRGYSQLPQARVAAICDVHPERAQALATEFALPDVQIYGDYHQMLAEAGLDAVSVCVPNALHAEVVLACLNARVHVLCEKPLAMNAAQAQQIVDAAQASGKFCMISQVLRFRDDVLELKRRAASIGDIYYVRTTARRARGIPKWGGWFTRKQLSGGGPLIDTGVHVIDLAWWLSGQPAPVSASAVTYSAFGPRQQRLGSGGAADKNGVFDVEDLAAGFVRFENGLSIHFEAAWAIAAEKDDRFCHLHGTEGALIWNDEPKVIDAKDEASAVTVEAGDAWRAEVAYFVDCIQNERRPDPDASQGLIMMKILDALYQSAETGREVAIS